MKQENSIHPIPIITMALFIVMGLFIDTLLKISHPAHMIFEVVWIAMWGIPVIAWIIYDAGYWQSAPDIPPTEPVDSINHPEATEKPLRKVEAVPAGKIHSNRLGHPTNGKNGQH